MLSFYQPGERFATMTAGGVAKIWRIDSAGVPVPDQPLRSTLPAQMDSDPTDPEGYRPRYRRVETTPEIPDVPVAPEGGEPK